MKTYSEGTYSDSDESSSAEHGVDQSGVWEKVVMRKLVAALQPVLPDPTMTGLDAGVEVLCAVRMLMLENERLRKLQGPACDKCGVVAGAQNSPDATSPTMQLSSRNDIVVPPSGPTKHINTLECSPVIIWEAIQPGKPSHSPSRSYKIDLSCLTANHRDPSDHDSLPDLETVSDDNDSLPDLESFVDDDSLPELEAFSDDDTIPDLVSVSGAFCSSDSFEQHGTLRVIDPFELARSHRIEWDARWNARVDRERARNEAILDSVRTMRCTAHDEALSMQLFLEQLDAEEEQHAYEDDADRVEQLREETRREEEVEEEHDQEQEQEEDHDSEAGDSCDEGESEAVCCAESACWEEEDSAADEEEGSDEEGSGSVEGLKEGDIDECEYGGEEWESESDDAHEDRDHPNQESQSEFSYAESAEGEESDQDSDLEDMNGDSDEEGEDAVMENNKQAGDAIREGEDEEDIVAHVLELEVDSIKQSSEEPWWFANPSQASPAITYLPAGSAAAMPVPSTFVLSPYKESDEEAARFAVRILEKSKGVEHVKTNDAEESAGLQRHNPNAVPFNPIGPAPISSQYTQSRPNSRVVGYESSAYLRSASGFPDFTAAPTTNTPLGRATTLDMDEEMEIQKARERLLQYRAAKRERDAARTLARELHIPVEIAGWLCRNDDISPAAQPTVPLATVPNAPPTLPIHTTLSSEEVIRATSECLARAGPYPPVGNVRSLVQHLEQHAAAGAGAGAPTH